MKKLLITLSFAFASYASCDELIRIPSPETGFFASSSVTEVVLWDNENPKGTVLFLPGGDGNFKTEMATRENVNRISVVGAVMDIPQWNVAAVNSPHGLGGLNVGARYTTGHIDRVISAIQILREKTNNKPVWLLGHSNGTVSALSTYVKLQKLNQENLIAGIILAGSRDVIEIPKKINVPILFVHHTNDLCQTTPHSNAMRSFDNAKSKTTSQIEFVSISDNPTGGGCYTGSHMFRGSRQQLSQAIDSFINPKEMQ